MSASVARSSAQAAASTASAFSSSATTAPRKSAVRILTYARTTVGSAAPLIAKKILSPSPPAQVSKNAATIKRPTIHAASPTATVQKNAVRILKLPRTFAGINDIDMIDIDMTNSMRSNGRLSPAATAAKKVVVFAAPGNIVSSAPTRLPTVATALISTPSAALVNGHAATNSTNVIKATSPHYFLFRHAEDYEYIEKHAPEEIRRLTKHVGLLIWMKDNLSTRINKNEEQLKIFQKRQPKLMRTIVTGPSFAQFLIENNKAHTEELREVLTAADIELTDHKRAVRALEETLLQIKARREKKRRKEHEKQQESTKLGPKTVPKFYTLSGKS